MTFYASTREKENVPLETLFETFRAKSNCVEIPYTKHIFDFIDLGDSKFSRNIHRVCR